VATQTQWILVDDLDGSRAATTVEFGLDRESYAIDLSDENAARLRAVLGEFVAAARVRHGAPTAALRHSPRPRTTVATPVAAIAPPAPLPSLRAELGEMVRELTADIRRALYEVLTALLDVLRGRQSAHRLNRGATSAGDGRA
jgi:Lsr2 protein